MAQPLLVSIIINNYNYGRFLAQAIDSALRQTHPPVEVIVVDDGSTDDSRSIIDRYGARVVPVRKDNGGQASALNAGVAHCHGEVVIFLDADDLLLPDIAARVAAVFEAQPEVAKVQYRLEVVDEWGKPTGLVRPPWRQPMPQGELRARVLAFPDDIPWQPTSGNAFTSKVLRRIFPVPEGIYRICADYYLANLTPLLGPVVSLEEAGGCYRVHSANNHHTSDLDLEQTRRIITLSCHTHRYIKALSDSLGLAGFPADVTEVPSVTFLAHRVISLKIDPEHHPLRADRLLPLVVRGVRASFGRFDRSGVIRSLYALWFVAMLVSPGPAARWLARRLFHPQAGGSYSPENPSGLQDPKGLEKRNTFSSLL